VIRAHQPGSEPIDIPETIPNPVVVPKPKPTPIEPAPKEPVRIPEKVPSGSGSDLPMNFHPAAVRASAIVTPSGAVRASGRHAKPLGGAAWRCPDPPHEYPSFYPFPFAYPLDLILSVVALG
jgi:hypothetical protein